MQVIPTTDGASAQKVKIAIAAASKSRLTVTGESIVRAGRAVTGESIVRAGRAVAGEPIVRAGGTVTGWRVGGAAGTSACGNREPNYRHNGNNPENFDCVFHKKHLLKNSAVKRGGVTRH